MSAVVNVLSIAGSDSSGGAGIQADLKTFTALGAYGATVVTALTAQNTIGVQDILPVDSAFVETQLRSIFDDLHIDAVKIGMLADPAVIRAVQSCLRDRKPQWTVLDPVMVAESGDRLVSDECVASLLELANDVSVVTPNLHEAAVLTNTAFADSEDAMKKQGRLLVQRGVSAAWVKGGHFKHQDAVDWWVDHRGAYRLHAERIETRHGHGTGCTLSSALAVFGAQGLEPLVAARAAKAYLGRALAAADQLNVGSGAGPVDHFIDHRNCKES